MRRWLCARHSHTVASCMATDGDQLWAQQCCDRARSLSRSECVCVCVCVCACVCVCVCVPPLWLCTALCASMSGKARGHSCGRWAVLVSGAGWPTLDWRLMLCTRSIPVCATSRAHTWVCARPRACVCAHARTPTRARTVVCDRTRAARDKRVCARTRASTRAHTHARTNVRARTHART